MRKIPISKVNNISRNGVIILKNTDTALPNVDKNNKLTKKNTKVQRTKNIILSIHEKGSKFTKQKYT